jgi:DnaJ-class molecular chaperone
MDVTLDELYHAVVKKVVLTTVTEGVPHKKSIYVKLYYNNSKVTFVCQGDTVNGMSGDVEFEIKVLDHPTHKIDDLISNGDLHTSLRIPFFEYLYGSTLQFDHFGTALKVEYDAQCGKRMFAFDGCGLLIDGSTRGTLYVFVDVEVPTVSPKVLNNMWTRKTLRRVFV